MLAVAPLFRRKGVTGPDRGSRGAQGEHGGAWPGRSREHGERPHVRPAGLAGRNWGAPGDPFPLFVRRQGPRRREAVHGLPRAITTPGGGAAMSVTRFEPYRDPSGCRPLISHAASGTLCPGSAMDGGGLPGPQDGQLPCRGRPGPAPDPDSGEVTVEAPAS